MTPPRPDFTADPLPARMHNLSHDTTDAVTEIIRAVQDSGFGVAAWIEPGACAFAALRGADRYFTTGGPGDAFEAARELARLTGVGRCAG